MQGTSAKVEYESGSGMVEVPCALVANIPGGEVTDIDTTCLGITDGWMTSEPGMIKPMPWEFTYLYDADTYADLDGSQGVVIGWRVSAPTAASQTFEFDGYVKKQSGDFEPNKRAEIKCEVVIVGKVNPS